MYVYVCYSKLSITLFHNRNNMTITHVHPLSSHIARYMHAEATMGAPERGSVGSFTLHQRASRSNFTSASPHYTSHTTTPASYFETSMAIYFMSP